MLGQSGRLHGQVGHCIHRVTDHNDDGVGGVLQYVLTNAFHNAGVYPNQLFAGHAGFTGQSGSNDHYITAGRFCVVVGRSGDFRVEAK